MEKLTEVIVSLTALGYVITFDRQFNQVQITLTNKKGVSTQSCLPDDHIYESKVVDCIYYMRQKLNA